MARIFLGLALFAVLLLASNLVLGLAVGDFGSSSRAFHDAKTTADRLEESADASLERVEEARQQAKAYGREMVAQRDRFWIHVWLGIIASLVSLLVNSISVTYFIGTSRWCREVVDAYGMDPEFADRSLRLKRRSFPWALTGILLTLVIAGLGAASDPYSSTANPSAYVPWHWILAMAGVVVIGIAFLVQVNAVGANYEIIKSILAEAERMRNERTRHAEAAVSSQEG